MTKNQLKLYLEFMLIKYDNDKNRLWINSIINNDYWSIKALLEDGYDFHKYGEWGLRWVCGYGHYHIAKLLIKYGANINKALYLAQLEPKEYNVIEFLKRYKK